MPFTRSLGTYLAFSHWLPSQCAVCRTWPSPRICAACLARFAPTAARCVRCAARVPDGVRQCGQCLREHGGLDHCIAAVDYGWPWAGLVARLKFHAEPGLAATLAPVMRGANGAGEALHACDALVPVPLAPQRLRQRGYNQSLLLARRICPGKLRPQWLERPHETEAQSHLGRHERLRNLLGAFAAPAAAHDELRGKHVLLVDDVMTTGATLHAAAHTLRAAGAGRVGALVFARTP